MFHSIMYLIGISLLAFSFNLSVQLSRKLTTQEVLSSRLTTDVENLTYQLNQCKILHVNN